MSNPSPFPQNKSFGGTQKVEVLRQAKISAPHSPQCSDPTNRLTELCPTHDQGVHPKSTLLPVDSDAGVDEDGYLSMRNIQALLPNAMKDYALGGAKHQKLLLPSDDHHQESTDGALFRSYEQKRQIFDDENEYISMVLPNGRCATVSSSDECESPQLSRKAVEERNPQTVEVTNGKRSPPVIPLPPRRATQPQNAREALQTKQLPPLPPKGTRSATSVRREPLDAFMDDRGPVPPPRTKRKSKKVLISS